MGTFEIFHIPVQRRFTEDFITKFRICSRSCCSRMDAENFVKEARVGVRSPARTRLSGCRHLRPLYTSNHNSHADSPAQGISTEATVWLPVKGVSHKTLIAHANI